MVKLVLETTSHVNRRVWILSVAFIVAIGGFLIGLGITTSVNACTYSTGTAGPANWTGGGAWTAVGTAPAGSPACGAYPGVNGGNGDVADIVNGISLTVNTPIAGGVTLNTQSGISSTVDIATGGALTLVGSSAVTGSSGPNTLSISGGTLTNNGTLAVTSSGFLETINFNSGTFNGTGNTTITGANTLFDFIGSGPMTVDQQTISAGAGGSIRSSMPVGTPITLSNAAHLIVNAGGTMDTYGDGQINGSGSTSFIQNAGVFGDSAGSAANYTIGAGVAFDNTATVTDSFVGTFSFLGGSSGAGHNNSTWTLAAGDTFTFGGPHIFNGTQAFVGASGLVDFAAGGSWSPNTTAFTFAAGINVQNDGSLSFSAVAPPQTVSVLGGSYTQTNSGMYSPRLGLSAGTTSDLVAVTGAGTLAGVLNAALATGYTPVPGNVFTIMTCSGGCSSGGVIYTPLPFPGGYFALQNTGNAVQLLAVASPDFALSISGPATANAGSTVTYTATLQNLGGAATSGTIAFSLTGGGTFTSGTATGWTCTPSGSNMTCTSTGAVGAASSTPFTIVTTAPANPPGGSVAMTISGTATSNPADSNPGNNTATLTTTVNAITDLQITKTAVGSFTAGQNVSYTIQVKNLGPSDAQSVTVTDTPGPGQTFVSNSGGCTTAYPCNLGTVTSGSTVTITSTYALASSATGNATNTASVSTTTPDSNSGNNSSTSTQLITTGADVAVTKSGPAGVSPGQNVTFNITITNNGPSDASTVSVTDAPGPNLTFVSATTAGGGCAPFPCTIPSLAAGSSATIAATYSVATTATGSVTNTVNANSPTPDAFASNNTATATVPIVPTADLAISKNGPATVVPGGNATFTIVVDNNGPSAATNVVINDSPGPGLTFVSATGGCTAFPCTVASLGSGGSISISATYRVASNATSVTNTADVTSATADSNTSNNTASVTRFVRTPCPTAPPVAVFPTDANGNIPVSGTISWTGVGATSYDVYLGPAGTGCNTLAGTVNTTSFTYTGLQPDTDYEFRVVANSPGCPPQSSACTRIHTAAAPCSLGTPTIIAPQDGATISSPLKLQWTPVQGATSYHVVVILNGSNVVDTTTTDTSLDVTIGNGSMTWMVSAVNSTCAGSPATARFGVCSPPPPPLAGVVGAPSSGHAYQVIVTNPQAGTTQYEYDEATNADFTNATTQTTAATSVTYQHDVGTAAQVFFYRVRAFNNCAAGGGGFSKTLRVVIVPNVVTTRPVLNVPDGTTELVVEQLFVPGQTQPQSFTVTVDKPWVVKIVPQFGTLTSSGETINFYIDPTQLTNGTSTFTAFVTTTPLTQSGRLTTNGNTSKPNPVTVNIVTPVVPVDPSAAASNSLVIPAVGHLVGLNSQWRSDIRVFNGSGGKLSYLLNFVSATSTDVKQTTISTAPGETTALDDIIHNWYGFGEVGDNASGVLVITPLTAPTDNTSALATLVSSRTYNLATNFGTLGQFIPAVPLSEFVGSGDSRLSMQQIAQTSEFRTNFGLVEASGQPASVVLSMFRSDGSKLFDFPVNLAAGQQVQLNGLLAQQGVTSLADGRMEVKVTGGDGKVTAYASVVDNASGDPLFVPGEQINNVAAQQLYVMPGVADLNTNSASWRTDMRIFNSGDAPQTATLAFYPEGEGKQPLTSTVTINPGEVKVLDNMLQSTFAAQNVGGAVHISTAANSNLVVTGRTYNLTAGGTLGQFIPAATLSDSINAGGRALNILQVEDSVRYRTNVGLAEMSGHPATVEISVVQPDTKVTPSIQLPLAANEFVQFPLSAFGLGDVYNVRVQVKVIDGSGNVTAYGSVIDQTTSAPTYVAAQ